MTHRKSSDMVIDAESRVRSNTSRAGFIAGMLIFLGFFVLGGAVGTPVYVKSAEILRVALRVGGLVMVGVAIWSAVGSPIALLLDSGVCGILGITLLVCTAMFFSVSEWVTGAGGLLGGVSLLVSCYHLFRDYRLLPDDDEDGNREIEETGDSTSTGRVISERRQSADTVPSSRAGIQRPRADLGPLGDRQEKTQLQTHDEREQSRGR